LRLLLLLAGLAASLAAAAHADGTGGPTKRDLACLAEAIYFEARGTGTEGEAAVAHVIVNRSQDPDFPGTVCGVVADGCQFSYRCDGRSDALADARARARAYAVAESVLGADDDPTGGALFFHSARARPGWFAKRERVARIGGNVFYR
jgi:spore germination cell wall hydrolase CwlJ-like protein